MNNLSKASLNLRDAMILIANEVYELGQQGESADVNELKAINELVDQARQRLFVVRK